MARALRPEDQVARHNSSRGDGENFTPAKESESDLITFDDAFGMRSVAAASHLCTDSLYRPSRLRYNPTTIRLKSHGEVLD